MQSKLYFSWTAFLLKKQQDIAEKEREEKDH